ncbi:MAG: hypothetical protein HYZ53_25940 [Planctomycetes bacterium]|nr:hypothetical protein [Planctomycetota bacterium]
MKIGSVLDRWGAVLQSLVSLGLYAGAALLLGLAVWPGACLCYYYWQATAPGPAAASAALPAPLRLLGLSVLGAASYFLYGISLMSLVVLLRWGLGLGIRPGRYPIYSLQTVRWAIFNTLLLLVRFTFMDFLRVTPLLPAFFRALGAKVGRRVQINTKDIADVPLLDIGDDAVLGGDVTVVCHSAEGGQLVVEPVRIGARAEIGVLAVLLPGVDVGDRAVVGAHAMVPKGTVIPPDTFWTGVPARQIGVRNPDGTWSVSAQP